jgi:LPXTG-motif cell wall-anchored protein
MKKKVIAIIRNKKVLGSLSTMLLVGAFAVSQSSNIMASADENTLVVSSVCTSTSDYSINLTGTFLTPATDVAINYVNIARSYWTQTATTFAIKVPGSQTKPYSLTIYFGTTPETMDVTCPDLSTAAVDTTEDGGVLPATGSNNYNYLVAGLGIALVGARGLLRRKSVQK